MLSCTCRCRACDRPALVRGCERRRRLIIVRQPGPVCDDRPKGDASDEEVLLQRRALETGYRYGTSIGLRYTFGSIYNNIMNPRLEN